MTINEFIRLSLNGESVILCDCTGSPKYIYDGSVFNLLKNKEFERIIDNDISSWEIDNGKICLNYIDENF